jgi:hypothetical protein
VPEGHDPDPAGRPQRACGAVGIGVAVILSVGVTNACHAAFTLAVACALVVSAGPAAHLRATGTGPAAHLRARATASGVAGQL